MFCRKENNFFLPVLEINTSISFHNCIRHKTNKVNKVVLVCLASGLLQKSCIFPSWMNLLGGNWQTQNILPGREEEGGWDDLSHLGIYIWNICHPIKRSLRFSTTTTTIYIRQLSLASCAASGGFTVFVSSLAINSLVTFIFYFTGFHFSHTWDFHRPNISKSNML